MTQRRDLLVALLNSAQSSWPLHLVLGVVLEPEVDYLGADQVEFHHKPPHWHHSPDAR